jgi:hypothetical protein
MRSSGAPIALPTVPSIDLATERFTTLVTAVATDPSIELATDPFAAVASDLVPARGVALGVGAKIPNPPNLVLPHTETDTSTR